MLIEIVYAKSCNVVHFGSENGSHCRPQCVLKHVNNGNGVPDCVMERILLSCAKVTKRILPGGARLAYCDWLL